ncbi:hypothetical protein HMPREF9151_01537 [Hoylesella saccharolytica F0055]|uniref:Uncharacterized protein n=1 Tax=Hoylesella saccharolytica F0055 TaxID=1127699 RepID=L1N8B9_9BACT|nr:hypothetical protein HMPREF9151_01537 [Hoylesella saccharolytica F0055]
MSGTYHFVKMEYGFEKCGAGTPKHICYNKYWQGSIVGRGW